MKGLIIAIIIAVTVYLGGQALKAGQEAIQTHIAKIEASLNL